MIAAVEDGETNETERLLDMQNKERNAGRDSCSGDGGGGCEGERRVVIMAAIRRRPRWVTRSSAIYSFHSYFSLVWSLSLFLSLSLLMTLVFVEFCMYVIIQSLKQGNIAEKRDTPTPLMSGKALAVVAWTSLWPSTQLILW